MLTVQCVRICMDIQALRHLMVMVQACSSLSLGGFGHHGI